MIKILIVFIVLFGGLVFGLIGMGLITLLPERIKNKIARFHDSE